MKLHLPKLLLAAVLAACVAPAAWAETYDLLSSDNWQMSNGQNSLPEYTAASGDTAAYITATNWSQALAVQNAPSRGAYGVGSDGVLTFAFTLQSTNTGAVAAITMTGTSQTLAFGSLNYSTDISYGVTSNTTADIYLNGSDANWNSGEEYLFDTTTEGTTDTLVNLSTKTSDAYTLTGTVTLSEGNYYLSISLDGTQVAQDVDLGTSFDISRITLQADGGTTTLTNASITGDLYSLRYDTTVSGSMAVNDATWIRNGEEYTTTQINMTDGTALLGLTGSGDDASISFAENTNVAIIDILGGTVTFGSSVQTTELTVADEATLGIAEDASLTLRGGSGIMNADFVLSTTGSGTIHVNRDINIGSEGGTSVFTGSIYVNSNTLYLGNTGNGGNEMEQIDLSATPIILNGGGIRYFGGTSTIGNLNVATSGELLIHATNKNANNPGTLNLNNVNVAENQLLTVNGSWEYNLRIGALTGEGSLQLKNGSWGAGTTTIESIGAGFGDITNDGTLNLVGQLAGNSTISGGTINVESTASVSGNITFGSDVNFAGTLTSTGSVTLSGNVYIDAISALENSGEVTYSTNDGKDGYLTSGLYYVVKGDSDTAQAALTSTSTLYEGSTAFGSITQSTDGKSLVVSVESEGEGIWYVNTQDFSVDGLDTNLAKDATGYKVAAGRTLTIAANQSDTMTSSKILAETVGEGNITVSTNATIGNGVATLATGTLTVNNGATLAVGEETGHTSSIASFGAVSLDGGTLRMHNNGSTVNNLTVASESTLHIQDAAAATSTTKLAGTTTLNAELNVTSGFKGTLTIDQLTGTGNLDIDADHNSYNDTLLVNINGLSSYSGIISYKSSTGVDGAKDNNIVNIKNMDGNSYAAISMGGLTLEGGSDDIATANVDIGRNAVYGANSLGAVTMSGGSVLNMFNRGGEGLVNMTSLTVAGTATIGTVRNANCYQSTVNIGTLANGTTDASATLNLVNGSQTTAVTAYNLNGGDGFNGTINVKGDSDSGADRRVALNINSANAAKGAVINFLDASTIDTSGATTPDANDIAANKIALGLGASATVAGLGAEVVEGQETVLSTNAVEVMGYKIKGGAANFTTRADDDTDTSARTLTIDTAEGKTYDVNANINSNINLVKSGSGTQNISGNMANFDGTVEVSGGVLGFTNAAEDASVTVSSLTLTGGTLNVTGSLTLDALSIDLTKYTAGLDTTYTLVQAGSLELGSGVSLENLGGDVGDYTATVERSGNSITLSFSEIVAPDTSITTTVTGFGSLTDGMLTLNVGADLTDATKVLISGISDDIMKQILGDANLPTDGMVGITLVGTDDKTFVATADQMIGFQGNEGIYYGQQVGSAWQYQAAYIPEPATTTLSLLALTALAARRRRK